MKFEEKLTIGLNRVQLCDFWAVLSKIVSFLLNRLPRYFKTQHSFYPGI